MSEIQSIYSYIIKYDIFLFNSNDTIEYQAAVREIRAFYNNLQKYRTTGLSNGVRKDIDIRFNHRFKCQRDTYKDTSGNGNLRIRFGDPLSASIHRPAMMISDVNWCHRLAFEAIDEVEAIGNGVYSIKYTDMNVYQYGYDEVGNKEGTFVYLCKKLFTNYIAIEKMSQGITEDVDEKRKRYYDDNNEDIVEISVFVTLRKHARVIYKFF